MSRQSHVRHLVASGPIHESELTAKWRAVRLCVSSCRHAYMRGREAFSAAKLAPVLAKHHGGRQMVAA